MARNQVNPPPLRTISNFKSKLTGGGARANLFEVVLTFPDTAQPDSAVLEKARFLVKAANLPASNVSPIEVPFRGRILKIAGDRTFDSWTVTVINDTDFAIRSAFERWQNTINRLSDNTGLVRSYIFYDTFPTQVGQIELAYDQPGIQEFTVELQVQYWEAIKGSGPNAGGEDVN